MATGINSFALLAIPFFILSGYIMGQGGIARRLIDFAKVIVGVFPGGLAYVNIVACMFFGAISGSAAAATSAVGGFMIPSMNKEGYDKNFNTALTVTASTTGLLIPPSNILIIFSLASGGVSIAALFIADIDTTVFIDEIFGGPIAVFVGLPGGIIVILHDGVFTLAQFAKCPASISGAEGKKWKQSS